MSFEVDNNYEWATHQPLIKAVLEVYKPGFILELGAGYHSTLVFKEYSRELKPGGFVSIDDNKEWLGYLNDVYKTNIQWHDTGMLNANVLYSDLTAKQKAELVSFYNSIEIPNAFLKLLFVDHFTSGRFIAISELKDKFELIIFHDCQPEGQSQFSYDLISYDGFETYYLKSETSWTCVMIKSDIYEGLKELTKAIQPYLFEFKMKYPEIPYMVLTDKY